jgi:hypothetical protein
LKNLLDLHEGENKNSINALLWIKSFALIKNFFRHIIPPIPLLEKEKIIN